jgi:hypothetical protein
VGVMVGMMRLSKAMEQIAISRLMLQIAFTLNVTGPLPARPRV